MQSKGKLLPLLCLLLLLSCDGNLGTYNVTNRIGIENYRGDAIRREYSYTEHSYNLGKENAEDTVESSKNNTTYNKCHGGYFKIGNPYKIMGKTYYPKEYARYKENGLASWYGDDFHNKKTANGEIFNMNDMTGAHKTLPLPSIVKVVNLKNGKNAIVRINDRGPFIDGKNRIIDLSKMAAKELGFNSEGVIDVSVELLSKETEKYRKKCGLAH
jgi:rare lipoprotein A (peptidoglycan hydrolase)